MNTLIKLFLSKLKRKSLKCIKKENLSTFDPSPKILIQGESQINIFLLSNKKKS